MLTKIQKWGNSQGLRIAKHILEDAKLNVGDEVDINVKNGLISIKPTHKIRGKYKIEDLVSNIPKDYKTEELDWGEPLGKEVW